MLTCIILCKGFPQGSRLMQSPQIPAPGRTGSYSLQRLSAILASKDFFTVMASSGHIS